MTMVPQTSSDRMAGHPRRAGSLGGADLGAGGLGEANLNAGSLGAGGVAAGDLGDRVLQEGRAARIEEILRSVAVAALGPGARVAVSREDWPGVEDAIAGPAAVAASSALERLATELEAVLPRLGAGPLLRLGDDRLRAELGYD
jgi:hypothetical protein